MKEFKPIHLIHCCVECSPQQYQTETAAGWIVLDEDGHTIYEESKRFKAQSLLQAETLAIKEILTLAKRTDMLYG